MLIDSIWGSPYNQLMSNKLKVFFLILSLFLGEQFVFAQTESIDPEPKSPVAVVVNSLAPDLKTDTSNPPQPPLAQAEGQSETITAPHSATAASSQPGDLPATGNSAPEPAAVSTVSEVSASLDVSKKDAAKEQGQPAAEKQETRDVRTQVTESFTAKKLVKSIEIKGNKTVNVSTILFKIKTRVGQEYLQGVISDDLKRLYNTGYFADVNVDRVDYEGGFKVIFFVTEKSLIDKITFSKLRYNNPNALLKKIQSKKGKFLDPKTVNDDIRTIKDLYAKKGLTQVEIEVETKKDDLTNKTALHFVVKEGERVRVKRIIVTGNMTYPSAKIIRLIKTRSQWLFNAGFFKADILDEDQERIKSFYEREGFIDAQAASTFEKINNKTGYVRIRIVEGKRYYVEQVSFVGNKIVDNTQLLEAMKEIKVGKVFSRERLSVDLSNIRVLYFDKGYIFANARESTSLNPETGKVEVKLDIEEGELAYVSQIKVQGNDRTRDIVIRRELRLFPGDRFDGEKLRRSKQRLTNLGYFEDINYDIEDTDLPNQKNLVVQVKEAKTGSFSFGGGYSTVDQFVGFVELEQKNFDFTNWPTFTGGGQDLSLRAETGSTRNNTRLSFTEPWLFDYPISAGFDLYASDRQKDEDVGYSYDERRIGGDLRLGKQFTEYLSGGVTYRLEEIEIGNFDDDVSADLKEEEGRNTVSSLSFSAAHDKRDNVFNPTRGTFVSQTVDVAGGILGGTKDFYRISDKGSYYLPLNFNAVVEFSLRAGMIQAYGDSEKVPIFERFYAGGAQTIRGYEERKVGPLDPVTGDPIGGNSLLVGNVEFIIPLIDFIKLAAFYDIGNVWAKVREFGSGGFKSGVGMGLRVRTPIGPVKLDYGYPLNDEPGETNRSGKFYFSISRGF